MRFFTGVRKTAQVLFYVQSHRVGFALETVSRCVFQSVLDTVPMKNRDLLEPTVSAIFLTSFFTLFEITMPKDISLQGTT